MNFIQLILKFIYSLLGIKPAKKQKPTTEEVQPPPEILEPEKEEVPEPEPEQPGIPAIDITDEMMESTLYLGICDKAVDFNKVYPLIEQYHIKIAENIHKASRLRHGDSLDWVPLKHVDSDANPVKALQVFLIHAGIFPPDAVADGFFGYGTLAGVRLFQEYVRIYEDKEGFWPDGVVGKGTWSVMKEWQEQGKTAENWKRGQQSFEYTTALELLNKAREHYLNQPDLIVSTINKMVDELNAEAEKKVDTFKSADWKYSPEDIHLIGIRRKEETSGMGRKNDDIFVLLLNGMVFIFGGSTDPNLKYANRKDEAFLVEGQHKFKFGWHKHSSGNESYQGLNPYDRGVLVFRDKDNTNKLTEADIKKGIDPNPNKTINIHWTGHGASGTWSAGCQVLAGTSYIDNLGIKRDMLKFAAISSRDFRNNSVTSVKKSKAAYNMFTDLVLLYGPKDKDHILYTLGRDETFDNQFLADLGLKERLDHTIEALGLPRGLGDA